MTMGDQVKQTISSLKGAKSTLETFALIEQNETEKHNLEQNISQIDTVIKEMEGRLSVLEYEEPQYKGF